MVAVSLVWIAAELSALLPRMEIAAAPLDSILVVPERLTPQSSIPELRPVPAIVIVPELELTAALPMFTPMALELPVALPVPLNVIAPPDAPAADCTVAPLPIEMPEF